MLREAFTKMIFVIFIISLIVTVTFLAAGLFYTLDPDAGDEDYYTESGTHVIVTQSGDTPKMFLFACTPFNIAVTVGLLYTWRVRKRRDIAIGNLPTHLSMYRITRLENVARNMKISMMEMDTAMKICMKEGTVRGTFNSSGEFVFEGTKMHAIPQGYVCPHCGGIVDKVFLEGEIARCSYCDAPLGAS